MDKIIQELLEPFRGSLEKFARVQNIKLQYIEPPPSWDTPYFTLQWLNGTGHRCTITLNHYSGNNGYLVIYCGGSNGEIGRQGWIVSPSELAYFEAKLVEAKQWADRL